MRSSILCMIIAVFFADAAKVNEMNKEARILHSLKRVWTPKTEKITRSKRTVKKENIGSSVRSEKHNEPHRISERLPVITRRSNYHQVQQLQKNMYSLHVIYTIRYPLTCECMLGKGFSSGTCYEFKKGESEKCEARKCRPSFDCVQGAETGITCMRKLITSRVMSNGDGTCIKKQVSGYAYEPYSSGAKY